MKVELKVIKGPQVGRLMEFREPRGFIIGRAPDADFQLPPDDPYVCRRHVFLEVCPPSCRIRDLGTDGTGATNTPHLNGQPVTEAELKHGDILELGYTQLKVSISVALSPRVVTCATCGKRHEILPDEPVQQRCPECEAARKPEVIPQQQPYRAKCSACNTDLTERANSDGRAVELGDAMLYSCEKHLPKGDAFTGTTVGDYRLIRRLGEGGFGSVYLVYHAATARVLALKQMKDLKDALLVKRFQREMRLMQGLTHGHVVRCVETGIDANGAPFVVTEYVTGGDLETLVLRSAARLPSEIAVHLILQVLDGLEYLHSEKIVHRDIKPPNILLRPVIHTGLGPYTAMISDFGLAKSYGRAGGTRITKPGTGMGTLMYMPPEQVRDVAEVREAADLYAVGVTLYYLLTGRYTFDFPTPNDILEIQKQKPDLWKKPQEALRLIMQLNRIRHPFQIILSEEPIPIRKRDGSISQKLADVVDKAVKKDQRERFQTAAELRSALQRAL